MAPFSAKPVIGAVRRVKLPAGQKLVALTFDLCEQPHEVSGYQGPIVDELRRRNVKATFFIGGKWILSHAERSEQIIADPLFEIGNHTWGHRNLRIVDSRRRQTEIGWAQLAYEKTVANLRSRQCPANSLNHVADRLQLFRFPYGACNAESLEAVREAGLVAIQWDVSSGDPAIGLKADAMVRDVVRRVKPGSIVLFHANGRGWQTPSALPEILEQLSKDGYKFVTVSELMAAGEPEISADCYDFKPNDTHRYDDLARRLEREYIKAEQLQQSPDASKAHGANKGDINPSADPSPSDARATDEIPAPKAAPLTKTPPDQEEVLPWAIKTTEPEPKTRQPKAAPMDGAETTEAPTAPKPSAEDAPEPKSEPPIGSTQDIAPSFKIPAPVPARRRPPASSNASGTD